MQFVIVLPLTTPEAANAMGEINRDYELHSKWARKTAVEYLDAKRVLGKFLNELGLSKD